MKQIDYIGAEGTCIEIEQPTDIYPLLDWCQSRMMDNQEAVKGTVNKEKWQNAIDYLDKLMQQVEKDGFGNASDIDKINY